MAIQTLTLKRTVNTSPAEVYRGFTNSTALRDWLCNAAEVEPRKGGRFYVWWSDGAYAAGHFTAAEPGKKVAWTWHHSREPEPASVQVRLTAKPGGTLVTFGQKIGSGRKWAEAGRAAQSAWENALENLQSVLERGVDLREARSPRIGIFIDDFNAEIAARLHVPVMAGIRLAGVAEGTGAEAAGLQKDDVLVSLGGKMLSDYASLTRAIQGRVAGDVIPVVFYRGAQKMSAPLRLSSRPPLEILPPDELIETMQKHYAEFDAAWVKLLEDVSEEEAAHHPGPNEWSLKESMAHFILCERDTQSWFAQMINDREIGESLEFRTNVDARLRALVDIYPTLPDLLNELKRSEQETLALLRRLPADFAAHKHVYARVSQWMTQVVPFHFHDEHLSLMQAAIQSARSQTDA